MTEFKIENRHIDMLTDILVKAVEQFLSASITKGHPDLNDDVEYMMIQKVASYIQAEETGQNADGTLNPNVVCCVKNAFELAFLKTGKRVYDGQSEKLYSYNSATFKRSFDNVGEGSFPLKNPDVVNISGMIGAHSIFFLGLTGYDLKECLASFTRPFLREVAEIALIEHSREIIALFNPNRGTQKNGSRDPKPH